MVKYGTDADFYGKKPFGFGAGLGYRVAGTLLQLTENDGYMGVYANPTVIAEVSLKAGPFGLLKARFVTDLVGATIDVPEGESRTDNFAGKLDLHYYALYLTTTKNF
jgi:hypothetical protein